MNILLYAVNPISGGEETELCFELSDGEHIEKKKLIITAEMFFELGFPHFPCGKVEISCGKLDEIEYLVRCIECQIAGHDQTARISDTVVTDDLARAGDRQSALVVNGGGILRGSAQGEAVQVEGLFLAGHKNSIGSYVLQ